MCNYSEVFFFLEGVSRLRACWSMSQNNINNYQDAVGVVTFSFLASCNVLPHDPMTGCGACMYKELIHCFIHNKA